MNDPASEAGRWLAQAEDDLRFARHALEGGFFHQVCFVAQQCAEKALKAILYAGGARSVIGHSVIGLVRRAEEAHPEVTRLGDVAAELDLFYIATRYPNGLVEGTPRSAFTRAQADRAIAGAEAVLAVVREVLAA